MLPLLRLDRLCGLRDLQHRRRQGSRHALGKMAIIGTAAGDAKTCAIWLTDQQPVCAVWPIEHVHPPNFQNRSPRLRREPPGDGSRISLGLQLIALGAGLREVNGRVEDGTVERHRAAF
jgi:hypothetical protein